MSTITDKIGIHFGSNSGTHRNGKFHSGSTRMKLEFSETESGNFDSISGLESLILLWPKMLLSRNWALFYFF